MIEHHDVDDAVTRPDGSDRSRVIAPSADELRELEDRFHACDADGDERIAFSEFERLLEIAGVKLTDEEERRACFSEIDLNRDGEIDFGEFTDWWIRRPS
ncbi:MAG: EF-hand domain-containing protein [Pseudomonadota bacterium]|jgi:Ca2+-binding protein (EF-Hand superfamily)|nr:MAG: hypothetical protein DIU56_03160 [Pseudomonadota bacterium]